MDYTDEQRNEIEALAAIYSEDMEIIATEPFYIFVIRIKTEEYEPGTGNGLSCSLQFTYTAKYPDEQFLVSIEDSENFEDGSHENLKKYLTEQIDENLGMVMAFTLVSAAQDWLNLQWDKIKLSREESAGIKLKEEEEAERKKFEGTRVTVKTFLSWKEKFDKEMGYLKKSDVAEREGNKLTGKELFMLDKTLEPSNLEFLNYDFVKVDESLFQYHDAIDYYDDDDDDDDDADVDDNGYPDDNDDDDEASTC